MPGNDRLGLRAVGRYGQRFVQALEPHRLAAALVVALLLSLGPLLNSYRMGYFSAAEIAAAWLEHFVEMAVIALALMVTYTALDETLPQRMRFRLASLCVALLAMSIVLTWLLYAYYAHGFDHFPPLTRVFADSLRWGLPAVFLALFADVHRRAVQSDMAANAAELWRRQATHGASDEQLALLQAQIEPHFLFNVLGNVRRLYRTRPRAGAEAIASLMRYLRTALPQLRNQRGSLGDELELVAAYLELFKVRMGTRLTFSIESEPSLRASEFPPMLLITLVENAIKHGLEPVGGGNIRIDARRRGNVLEVGVLDDGVGFAATASSGTGVGLVNVRRQLAARYAEHGRLLLEAREPRGARALIALPLRAVPELDANASQGAAA